MYTQDYDEALPGAYIGAPGPIHYWHTAIDPYIRSGVVTASDVRGGIWTCPSFPGPYHPTFSIETWPASFPANIRSYGYSFRYLTLPIGLSAPSNRGGPKLSEVERPAETVMIGDSGPSLLTSMRWSSNQYCIHVGDVDHMLQGNREHVLYLRHHGKANVGFVDGHAKAVGKEVANDEYWWRTTK